MPSENKDVDPFKELRWETWRIGQEGKATEKGIKYQEEGRIKELKRTPRAAL